MPASIPRIRLTVGELFAEILDDRRCPEVFLCVVQRYGSPEVLYLGQSKPRSEAERAANEFINDYLRTHKSPKRTA